LAARHAGAEADSPKHEYLPQHSVPETRFSPESERLAATQALLEHFRTDYGDPEKVTIADTQVAIALASHRDMPPEVGQELVGTIYEVNQHAMAAGDRRYAPFFDELKLTVYGTTEVEPVVLRDQAPPGQQGHMLKGDTRSLRWHGSPIEVRALGWEVANDYMRTPDASIMLTHGRDNTWNAQIGTHEPFVLEPEKSMTLGRHELGGHVYTSREHLDLVVDAGGDLVVRDRKKTGTRIQTRDFPDPRQYQEQRARREQEERSGHGQSERLAAARAQLGQASEDVRRPATEAAEPTVERPAGQSVSQEGAARSRALERSGASRDGQVARLREQMGQSAPVQQEARQSTPARVSRLGAARERLGKIFRSRNR
jgi:hypothetical protein